MAAVETERAGDEVTESATDSTADGYARTSADASAEPWVAPLEVRLSEPIPTRRASLPAQIRSHTAMVVAVAALLLGAYQAYLSRSTARETSSREVGHLDSQLALQMMAVDQYFADRPELRPYFYDNRPVPRKATRLRARALATAELLIDFADAVASYAQTRAMPRASRARWAAVLRAYFDGSPITRLVWKRYAPYYGRATACVLGGPADARGWDWREGVPRAEWSNSCSGAGGP